MGIFFWTLKEKSNRIIQRIKFEDELDLDFGEEVAAKAYGQKLLSCIQCGTCSATCPLSHYMDFTPRRIMAMVREGFRDEVLNSRTIWLCVSCYSCTVQCPRNIHITDVMYTLKREAIARGLSPHRYPITVLARQFFKGVFKTGRSSEGRLIMKLFLFTNPFAAFRQMTIGIRLFLKGRISFKKDSIKGTTQLKKILAGVNGGKGGAA